jgi:F-type H+-transporting ATPase subunit b
MRIFGINLKFAVNHLLAVMLFVAVAMVFPSSPALGSGETQHQTAGHGDSHETKGWVSTDTFRVINFAILAVGLFILLKKPVSQALGSRISGIKEQLAELEEKKQAAEKELAGYAEKLAQLESEAGKIIEEYIRQGNEAKARILKEAEATAGKLEEKARKNIEQEFKQAKLKLQAEIIEKALVLAEKRILEKITPEDQNKLVDEYLEKVVA